MRELQQQTVECPYCGEKIGVLIEPSAEQQEYIEDCQVCCRPIHFAVAQDAVGSLTVTVTAENE